MDLSLILPCRNQGDHLRPLLPRFLDALTSTGLAVEMIVVPNASSDDTAAIARAFAVDHAGVIVVENERGGWGRSVRMGLAAASGAVLCYTNTARTDPASLPTFVDRYRACAPCLLKARRWDRAAPLRSLGSALYNAEARVLFDVGGRDVNGTPKFFPLDFYRSIELTADGDLLDLELMVWARRRGLRVEELAVRGFSRHGGKSSTNVGSAWRMYWGALRLWVTSRG